MSGQCSNCGRRGGNLRRCGGPCGGAVAYCNQKCQSLHWTRGGHNQVCQAIAASAAHWYGAPRDEQQQQPVGLPPPGVPLQQQRTAVPPGVPFLQSDPNQTASSIFVASAVTSAAPPGVPRLQQAVAQTSVFPAPGVPSSSTCVPQVAYGVSSMPSGVLGLTNHESLPPLRRRQQQQQQQQQSGHSRPLFETNQCLLLAQRGPPPHTLTTTLSEDRMRRLVGKQGRQFADFQRRFPSCIIQHQQDTNEVSISAWSFEELAACNNAMHSIIDNIIQRSAHLPPPKGKKWKAKKRYRSDQQPSSTKKMKSSDENEIDIDY